MDVGIDSFAASNFSGKSASAEQNMTTMADLLERVKRADETGLDAFGIGEHHRKEFLDSAPITILSAAAAMTKTIRLTSAVTVLSAADPVRVFQEFASLDIISRGRAEIVAGRGSFVEAYPLFGLDLQDYDALFAEKLNLLLAIRDQEVMQWKGRFRAALDNVAIYPRPVQSPLPVWVGVGGTPQSFIRAGSLGLPLMVAIIGGETRRFRPLIDLYREAGRRAGFPAEQLKVGLHSTGYVAETSQQARDEFYPGYAESFTKIGKERGFPPVTRSRFDGQTTPEGAFLIGSPQEVAEKIWHHSEALGGIDRVMFQMDSALLPQANLLKSIELIGQYIAPLLRTPTTTMNKPIESIYSGQRADIGEMIIYRMLPNQTIQTVGPFIFLDYISRVYYKSRVPQKRTGRGAHPHRGIATFTYLLQGEFEHYDSRGHYGVVGDGGAQWMKAGNGVIHDEYFSQSFQQRGGPLLGHQFWINLPAKAKQEAPDYLPVHNDEFPKTTLPDGAGFFKVVIGTFGGQTSPVKTYSEQFLYHIQLQPGKAYTLGTRPDLEYAAFLSNGGATVNDAALMEGELLVFGQEGSTIIVANVSDSVADVLIFGGEPYLEPIISHGPFVMNFRQEITQAFHDFNAGAYGSIDYSHMQTIPEL